MATSGGLCPYLLRSQDDYRDVFHLNRFASAHSDWKPFLAHILGFNAELVESHYTEEEELSQKQATVHTITNELGGSVEDLSKIEGLLLLKKEEAQKKQKLLDAFDFRAQDLKMGRSTSLTRSTCKSPLSTLRGIPYQA